MDKHFYFDLVNEEPETFEVLDNYLNLVFTETGKENWLDSQFAMTVDDWYEAIAKLGELIHTPFNK